MCGKPTAPCCRRQPARISAPHPRVLRFAGPKPGKFVHSSPHTTRALEDESDAHICPFCCQICFELGCVFQKLMTKNSCSTSLFEHFVETWQEYHGCALTAVFSTGGRSCPLLPGAPDPLRGDPHSGAAAGHARHGFPPPNPTSLPATATTAPFSICIIFIFGASKWHCCIPAGRLFRLIALGVSENDGRCSRMLWDHCPPFLYSSRLPASFLRNAQTNSSRRTMR